MAERPGEMADGPRLLQSASEQPIRRTRIDSPLTRSTGPRPMPITSIRTRRHRISAPAIGVVLTLGLLIMYPTGNSLLGNL
jgi:hypothetical protein